MGEIEAMLFGKTVRHLFGAHDQLGNLSGQAAVSEMVQSRRLQLFATSCAVVPCLPHEGLQSNDWDPPRNCKRPVGFPHHTQPGKERRTETRKRQCSTEDSPLTMIMKTLFHSVCVVRMTSLF